MAVSVFVFWFMYQCVSFCVCASESFSRACGCAFVRHEIWSHT